MKRIERIAFVAGLLLMGWLFHQIGVGSVLRNLSALGWGFLLVLGLHVAPILLNTLSWQLALPGTAQVPLRALVPMLVAGEAVNSVSPVGLIGGELVRVTLIRRRLPMAAAVGSAGLAAMSQFAAQVLFIVTGMPVVLHRVVLAPLRPGLVAVSVATLALLGAVLLLSFWPAALAAVVRSVGRFAPVRGLWERLPESWHMLGPELVRALRARPSRFVLSVAASFGAWQMGAVETFLVLRLLHQPVSVPTALAIEILAVAIEGALFFVPAKVGTQEGGRVFAFLALGLDVTTGLALGLIRRLREVAWAAVGLGALGLMQRRGRTVSADAADYSW